MIPLPNDRPYSDGESVIKPIGEIALMIEAMDFRDFVRMIVALSAPTSEEDTETLRLCQGAYA